MTRERAVSKICAIEPKLKSFAYSRLQNQHDAEDAVQNAFVKAWKYCASLREEKCFLSWMYRIVRNECAAIQRQNALRQETLSPDGVAQYRTDGGDMPDRLVIRLVVQGLPAMYVQAITLYYFQGWLIKDIASMLHKPEATIRSRIFRAKNMLLYLLTSH